MAVMLALTVNTGSKSQGETIAAECSLINHALDLVRGKIGGSHLQAGNITDRNGLVIGNWVYTPVATQ